jgi:hypothetical protein
MKFWDASAIVPLLITEPRTKTLQALAEKDPAMLVWWASEVECAWPSSRGAWAIRSIRWCIPFRGRTGPFEVPRKRTTANQPQFHIEGVFSRDTITFHVDPENLWPRTVTDDPAAA